MIQSEFVDLKLCDIIVCCIHYLDSCYQYKTRLAQLVVSQVFVEYADWISADG